MQFFRLGPTIKNTEHFLMVHFGHIQFLHGSLFLHGKRASSGMAKNPGKDTMLGPCDLWLSFNQQTFPFNGPRMDDLKT